MVQQCSGNYGQSLSRTHVQVEILLQLIIAWPTLESVHDVDTLPSAYFPANQFHASQLTHIEEVEHHGTLKHPRTELVIHNRLVVRSGFRPGPSFACSCHTLTSVRCLFLISRLGEHSRKSTELVTTSPRKAREQSRRSTEITRPRKVGDDSCKSSAPPSRVSCETTLAGQLVHSRTLVGNNQYVDGAPSDHHTA